MKTNVAAFGSGLLFAIGLSISGMTMPTKVIGFLDFAGAWDPSLACVMAGAMAVYFVVARWARSRPRPLLAASFQLPTRRDVDAPLVLGSAIFGVGWGLAGYCPGPAVTSVASLGSSTVTFVGSMLVGMLALALVERARRRRSLAAAATPSAGPGSSAAATDTTA
jgi:uncharacterized membrane protein YedE/YeeE